MRSDGRRKMHELTTGRTEMHAHSTCASDFGRQHWRSEKTYLKNYSIYKATKNTSAISGQELRYDHLYSPYNYTETYTEDKTKSTN